MTWTDDVASPTFDALSLNRKVTGVVPSGNSVDVSTSAPPAWGASAAPPGSTLSVAVAAPRKAASAGEAAARAPPASVAGTVTGAGAVTTGATASGTSPITTEKLPTPVKVAKNPVGSTVPKTGGVPVSTWTAGTRVPLAVSILKSWSMVPASSGFTRGRVTVAPGDGNGIDGAGTKLMLTNRVPTAEKPVGLGICRLVSRTPVEKPGGGTVA